MKGPRPPAQRRNRSICVRLESADHNTLRLLSQHLGWEHDAIIALALRLLAIGLEIPYINLMRRPRTQHAAIQQIGTILKDMRRNK